MSSKLFDIYIRQLNSIFEKISKILEALSAITDDKFYFLFNELEINFKECEKKFHQMDFELLTIRSTIQKEKIAQEIANSKEVYENYKEKAYRLKDNRYKPKAAILYEDNSIANKKKDQYHQCKSNDKQDKLFQTKHKQNNPQEAKGSYWLSQQSQSRDNDKHQHKRKEDNLESYRIAINEESSSSLVFEKEGNDNKINYHQKEKYSKTKLSRLYRGKLLLSQINQKYPNLLKYVIAILIIVIFFSGMIISSNYINESNHIRHIILRPEEIVANIKASKEN